MVKIFSAVAAVVLCLVAAGGDAAADGATHAAVTQATVKPVDNTVITYDTLGARIDAHDGTVVQDGAGTAYLFGTSYGCGFTLNVASPYCGVRVYRSTDLQTWTPAGAVGGMLAFDPYVPEWQSRCGGSEFGCFRPHVAQRPDGTWVMWLNVAHSTSGYAVLTAQAPGGPYTEVATPPVLAINDGSTMPYGDEDLVVDPADPSTAYLAYTVIDHSVSPSTHDIAVEKLDPTWTTGTGQTSRLGRTLVEAPGMFKRGSLWYLTYSDPACAYCITGASYATAPSPLGPWTVRTQLRAGSCGGQTADVDVLRGPSGATYYVWQVDRWAQGSTGGLPNQYQSNNYLAPLTFNTDGTIPGQSCVPTWTFS